MCLGIPGKVVWITGERAGVDFGARTIEAGTHLVENLVVGEYVLVHSGYILERLDIEDALETLKIFEQLAQAQEKTA